MRWAWLGLMVCTGCGSCGDSDNFITGEVRLAAGVDLTEFHTLEIRAYRDQSSKYLSWDTPPADEDIPMSESVRLRRVEFPYAYSLSADPSDAPASVNWRVLVWPADVDAQPAWPRQWHIWGSAHVDLGYQSDHGPAYADDVHLWLDHHD